MMKKIILIVLIFDILAATGVFVVGFMQPQIVRTERSLTVNAPAKNAFVQVNTLRNWEKWSPWHQIDPDMNVTYVGESGKDASYTWTSENPDVGNGKLSITSSTENEKVLMDLDFAENGTGKAEFEFQKIDENTTKVIWRMDSDMSENPFYKFMGLFMDSFLGEDFEKGLKGIKKAAENMPKENPPVDSAPETAADSSETKKPE